MEKNNSKFGFITAIIALIVLSLTLIIGCVVINNEGVRSKAVIDGQYRRAFYDMSDGASNIEINLSKIVVSPAKSETIPLLTNLSAQAELAENSLSVLPVDYHQTVKTSRFFNQVGDWCRSYARAIALGNDTSKFNEQANVLYSRARELNANIEKLKPIVEKGIYNLSSQTLAPSGYEINFDGRAVARSVDYPKLIYDGPFSDANGNKKCAVNNLKQISSLNALNKAQKVLKLSDCNIIGHTAGDFDCYQISGYKDGNPAFLSISRCGGVIVNYDIDRTIAEPAISKNKAIICAQNDLEKLGFENLKAVWYNQADGVAYINLAPKIDGVVYYPDLVKVKVALDNGEIIGIESAGYCNHHTTRSYRASISKQSASKNLSDLLHVNTCTLAVIPDGQNGEKLCFEFACEKDGLDYFVYIDAMTGQTRQILRVVNNDQGSLVM